MIPLFSPLSQKDFDGRSSPSERPRFFSFFQTPGMGLRLNHFVVFFGTLIELWAATGCIPHKIRCPTRSRNPLSIQGFAAIAQLVERCFRKA